VDDVVDGLGHRRKGIVRSEDDVIVAEDFDRRVQRFAVVGQAVAPQPARQPAWQVGRVCGHTGDSRPFVQSADQCRQRAAAVCQADSHPGPARERAADQQRRRCQCRLNRHPRAEAQSQLGHPRR
jgi:hypothetical protein